MFILVSSGSLGGWGSFAQVPGPSQGPRYALGTSGGTGPSTDLFAGGDDGDSANTDMDQFIGDDDSL